MKWNTCIIIVLDLTWILQAKPRLFFDDAFLIVEFELPLIFLNVFYLSAANIVI